MSDFLPELPEDSIHPPKSKNPSPSKGLKAMNDTPLNKANPEMLRMWTTRNKCWMCKHKFKKPVTLPVEKITPGKLQPNINVEVLFHMSDTHGLPPAIVREWIIGSVYGMELSLFGIKGITHDEL